MIRAWRTFLAALCFFAWGLGTVLIWPVLAFPVLSPRALRRIFRRSAETLLKCLEIFRLVRLDVDSVTRVRLKATGARIVCANHGSFLDVLFLVALLPDATCLVKASALKNPFLAGVVRRTLVANDDPLGAFARARAFLGAGIPVIVFPEGTRTPVGCELGPLHGGAARLACLTRVPIEAYRLTCTPRLLGKNQPWYAMGTHCATYRMRHVGTLRCADAVGSLQWGDPALRAETRRLTDGLSRLLTGCMASEIFACMSKTLLLHFCAMGQQLRTRAKRARRQARNKRAHVAQMAAKKK